MYWKSFSFSLVSLFLYSVDFTLRNPRPNGFNSHFLKNDIIFTKAEVACLKTTQVLSWFSCSIIFPNGQIFIGRIPKFS